MPRTRNQLHHAHPCQRRRQTEKEAERSVTNCTGILPTLDQADSLHAESGERGESATESNNHEGPQIVVGLDIHKLANENSCQKTARHVHEQGTERKSVGSKVLDPAAYQIAEHGTCGASKCDDCENHSILEACPWVVE